MSYFRDFEHPWIKGVKFHDINLADLWKIYGEWRPAHPSAKPRAWVLDLDSTLFCLGPRIRKIYWDFLRQLEAPPPHWQRLYAELRPETQKYDVRETFEDIFKQWNSQMAAEWAQELWRAFRVFWFSEFFSSRHSHHDLAYPGAVDFVKKIQSLGDTVVYLTGRDAPGQRAGTVDGLRTAGFPWGPHVELVMKASSHEPDVEYKQKQARDLHQRYEIAVFIDNEPENLVMFAKENPEANMVLFHSIMSARLPATSYQEVLGLRPPLRLSSYES